MAGKRLKRLDSFLAVALFIVCACQMHSILGAAVDLELSLSLDRNTKIDKHRCEHYTEDSIAKNNRSVESTSTASHNSNNSSDSISSNSSSIANNGVRLNCSESALSYKNATEDEFIEGLDDDETLNILSFHRKYEPGTFCIAAHNNRSTPSSASAATVRIALCEQHARNHHHQQQHELPTPHSITDSPTTTHSSSLPAVHLRKCCGSDERLKIRRDENGMETYSCMPMQGIMDESWDLAIFNSTDDDYSMHRDLSDFTNVNITHGFPICLGLPKSLNNSKDIWFLILASGSVEIGLKFWFKPVWLPVEDNEFCLDELLLDHDPSSWHEENTKISSHDIYHKNQAILYCQIDSFDDYLFHRHLFGGMCVAAAGIVFILLIIYVAIWDKQNLAGWTQFNIFVALFFVVLMEGTRTLFDVNGLQVQTTSACVIVAAIAQYFFFALNTTWSVMCFDLFYMFWKLETTSKTAARYRNRLIGYLLFSWGVPLVVVCIAFYFTHQTATEEMEEMKGVYAFAHRRCSSPIRKLGFQTQGIMFLLNLFFFFLTTLLIWKHRRGLNAARKKSRNERHTWRSVCLFMKLVVVMGVASLSIPVDYFFVSSAPLSTTAICFRMIHFIPFFAVLFIFGFNEKNMILISQKYPRLGKYFGFVACTSGATVSDTVNHSRSGNNRISDHHSSQT